MKKTLLFIAVVASTLCLSTSCTKYNFVDTGKAIGYHDCSMWEYFQQDPYNWDSLVVMSERAGLQQVFMGTSTYGTNLTVFGITNHSIRRYLLEKGYEQIADIPVEDCRNFILSSIIDGNNVIQLDDFTAGTASTDPNTVIGQGGKMYTMLSGKQLWIYTYRESYGGVPQAGPKKIYIASEVAWKTSEVASSNIMTQTGVVHALSYNFNLTDF